MACFGLDTNLPLGVTTTNCDQYLPGVYSGGINVQNNRNAIFQPGGYVMQNGSGFTVKGTAYICGGLRTDPNALQPVLHCNEDPTTGDGMLVYNQSGGYFQITAGGSAILQGPPLFTTDASGNNTPTRYAGILFFQDRTSPATGNGASQQHQLGGGGLLQLQGTVYITNTTKTIKSSGGSQYQLVNYHGNPGSGTFIVGEIIVDALSIVGGSQINMQLEAEGYLKLTQIALIGGGPHS
jgi:hypothetical protein